jgi:hypothetical protein
VFVSVSATHTRKKDLEGEREIERRGGREGGRGEWLVETLINGLTSE